MSLVERAHTDAIAWERSVYRPPRYSQGPAAGLALLIVGGLIASLTYLNAALPPRHKPHDLLVVSVPLTAPPPPKHAAPAHVVPKPTQPEIVAPVPVVAMPTPLAAVATTPVAPPQVVLPGPPTPPSPAAPAASSAVAEGGDLSSKMIFAKPPTYPLDSRRRHEEGVVVLTLLVSVDGSVSDISVGQTSGSASLDRAALDAVRKWRWAPLLRNGQPVMVQGQVRIPFVLKR